MGLDQYWRKRDFGRTPEPRGVVAKRKGRPRRFCVQKHAASHLHYDFRLELEGVLKSWAVPKGPSLDPSVRRLAMPTEDHPLDYGDFEGVIPEGQYGGGTVLLWDRGTWIPLDDDPHRALRAGRLRFELRGRKLRGAFVLARASRDDGDGARRPWQLIKGDDASARRGDEVTDLRPESVATGRDLEAIARDRDRVWDSRVGEIGRAPRESVPKGIRPRPPTRAREVPEGDAWLHEIAVVGERALARVDRGRIELRDARDRSLSRRFPAVISALREVEVERALVDGIVARLRPDGTTAAPIPSDRDVTYFVFDLLHLDGDDLRERAYEERRQALEDLIAGSTSSPHLRLAGAFVGRGDEVFAKGCELGAPAIVSKLRDAAFGARSAVRIVPCPKRTAAAAPRLTKPDKLLWRDDGITKRDLAEYYAAIAEHVVPHVRGRPLTLVRAAGAVEDGVAYMKHSKVWGPEALRRIAIQEKTKIGEYLVADSIEAVLGLVQMSVVEIHTWNAVDRDVERPDRVVFDLDPDPSVSWPRVVDAARRVRAILASLGLSSFVKTTGGKGLHVVSPLSPSAGWDACLAFSREIAERLAREDPSAFTAMMPKARRRGRTLIDYLRNNRGNTSVAAFSTRARPGVPVSMPIAWSELGRVDPTSFTLRTVPRILARRRRDPWAGYDEGRRPLPDARSARRASSRSASGSSPGARPSRA